MIDQDEIRAEIAVKTGVLLGRNDPMMQSITIFEKALEQSVATLNAQNVEHQKRIVEAVIAIMAESLAKEKETAGTVITAGTDYVSKNAGEGVQAAFAKGLAEMDARIKRMEKEPEETTQALTWAGWLFFFMLGAMLPDVIKGITQIVA